MKDKLIFVVVLILFIGCTASVNKVNPEQNAENVTGNELPSCNKIEQYPTLFSFASDSLKEVLLAKIQKPLTTSEKEVLFKFDDKDKYVPFGIFNTNYDFEVFAVNKISYETGTLVVYLVIEPQTEYFNENDQIVMVLYDKIGIPTDIISKVLVDVYGSTYEIEFSTPNEFTVTNIDYEYSPDPESEAEDIANGRVIEPSYMKSFYKVEELKFVEK